MDVLPFPLLVVLILVAVVLGLWVGGRANREVEQRTRDGRSWGARLRDATGRGVVAAVRWSRQRKRSRARDEREG